MVDLSSGTTYGLNSESSFRAASVNKLPILIALYQAAAAGKVDLDRVITIQDEDIQHYGTGVIQEADAPRTYTLRELAALMIEVSDNTAAHVLEAMLGEDVIQQSLSRWGLTHTSMADNVTTPLDMATLLTLLYRHELLSPQATDVALTLLTHTVFTDRIEGGVPNGVTVAHKVGTDTGVFNDAALVLEPHRPYALVVLSTDADEGEAGKALPRISGSVYEFERRLSGHTPQTP